MGMWPVRTFFHVLLLCSAIVLLGLTAYRISYTRNRDFPDVLTNRTNYYDPIMVELLVTSCLAILGSLWFISILAARSRARGLGSFASEAFYLFIIFVMFLVGAAYTTHNWRHLGFCRGAFRQCRILESIKAFSWICWGLVCFLLIFHLVDLFTTGSSYGDEAAGRQNKSYTGARTATTAEGYPETRTAHTNPQPVGGPVNAPANAPATRTDEATFTEVRLAGDHATPQQGHTEPQQV